MQPERNLIGGLQSGHTVNLTDVQYTNGICQLN